MGTRARAAVTARGPTGLAAVPAQRQLDGPDSVRLYLREIGRIPLLTADDEVRLARSIEVGVLAAERLAEHPVMEADQRAELCFLIELGETDKATLVKSNLRLVVAVAKRYVGAGTSLLDLIQEGNIGLIRAVEKFDYRRGFKFSTYATWWIRQAISRAQTDQSRTIRVPVHVMEAVHRARREQRALYQLLGRNPTVDELAQRLGTTPDSTQDLLTLAQDPISLDLPVGDAQGGRLSDLIVDDTGDLPLDEVGLILLDGEVERLLGLVTDRERLVLTMRFGLAGGRPHTLQEVGGVLGVTRERARQIESKALAKIRVTQSLENYRGYLH